MKAISAKGLMSSLAVLTFGAFLSLSALATDSSGYLTGSVVDPNGDTLPGVTVRVENPKSGLVRTAVTNADGEFRFPLLPIGSYDITATFTGFQTTKRSEVHVGIGDKTTINITLQAGDVSETLTVTAASLLVDVTTATSGLTVRTDELMERVPVPRDQTSVALLAPGSLDGDTAFNEEAEEGRTVASIGGASVAENAYLVNGMNTTNFRNGLGGSQVPFEFLEELQVKTGGYQAEFGRSTGGVINTVTKSGNNEFHAGLTLFWEPDSLSETEPDTVFRYNTGEEREVLDANFYASGPIVKDKAFFYVLYNPRDREVSDTRESRDQVYKSDDSFWGAKLDWHITPDHIVEVTAFTDKQDTTENVFTYDPNSGRGGVTGDGLHNRGGDNYIVKYTGILSSNMTISAQYGKNEFNRTDQSSADLSSPVVIDSRDGGLTEQGSWVNFTPSIASDEREAYRVDLDYYIGSHNIRAGIDFETNTSDDQTVYSGPDVNNTGNGGNYYRYFFASAGQFEGIAEGTLVVRDRQLNRGGNFETLSNALFIQDSWSINDNITLNVGLRNESYNNKNANGESFIKVDNQIAPRIGFIWDPKGDGTSKVYANYGKYYLPIASNTNIRMSGAEYFTEDWYQIDGINADWTPIVSGSPTILEHNVFGDGEVPDAREVRDTTIKPMFQNEYVVGYDTKVGNNWSFGGRIVHRDLGRTIEDIAVDAALNAMFPEADAHGFDYYVLTNPGTDLTFFVDYDHDGDLDEVTLPAELLGYPEAERKYYAVELTFNRRWADNWMLQGSYTWSHSYGNYEGWVRSDNGQDDAGITTLFDQPGLLDGAYGNLPNDRRHNLKVFGAYGFDNGLSVGANVSVRSGRPVNAFGVHPTDEFAADYGTESFFFQGVLQPRGSHGTTDTIKKLDLTAQYPLNLGRTSLNFRVDVFNVFDFDDVTEVYEEADDEAGNINPNWLQPTHYQTPRRVRFSASLRF